MQPLEVEKCNILSKFEEWKLELSGKKILIFLDYDGTCTPIVNNPNEAILSNDMREAIRRLQEYFITGVITGRSLEKIQSFVQIQDNLFYAGSHGFDIQGPKDTSIRNSVAADIIPKLASIRSSLLESFKDISGADVEDNVYSITVHYRNVKEDQVPFISDTLDNVLVDYPDIRRSAGKMVYELKPKMEWNKGKAVLWLLEALHLKDREDVFTVYVGDDTTDEDAFEIFRGDKPNAGVGILVSDHDKESKASYTLKNPDQVCEFVLKMIEYGKTNQLSPKFDL